MVLYGKLSDHELTVLLKADDKVAFTEIHQRYYGILYSHAYRRLQDREEVKDILQELFIYLWNNRNVIHFTSNLPSYLYTSVRNRILNVYKHKKIQSAYVESLQEFVNQGEVITDALIREKELIELLEKEVATLPPQMRLVFELSRNSHLTHSEIAKKLNISPLTVRKQINNALKILRVKLGTYFFIVFF